MHLLVLLVLIYIFAIRSILNSLFTDLPTFNKGKIIDHIDLDYCKEIINLLFHLDKKAQTNRTCP